MAKIINHPPTADFTMSETEITLPVNEITVDASKSSDPDPGGRVEQWHWGGSPGVVFADANIKITKATAPKNEGIYDITLYVQDRAGNKSPVVTKQLVVKPEIIKNKPIDFGYKAVDLDASDQVIVGKKIGVSMLRTSVEMNTFDGKAKFIDDVFAGGLLTDVNINWQAAGQVRKFCTGPDLITYGKNLRWFFDVFAPKGGVRKITYAFCENEQTKDEYFNDKIENYVPELQLFAQICNEYNVPCACGGVFIEFIDAFLNGGLPNNQNYKDNMWLIDQMVNIPLTHANVHYALKGTYKPGVIPRAMKWLSAKLNRPVGTNEFHVSGASTSQVTDAMNEFISAEPAFIQPWGGGGGSSGDPFNIGTDLTDRGLAVKNVIEEYNKTL